MPAMPADFGVHALLTRSGTHLPHGTSTSFQQPTTASYGGLMSQGYVPPGQFEDLLNLIRQASAASERAMNAAKYAEMAASAAGAAGQQAVVRAMHMSNAPGAPTAAPFSPGQPDVGMSFMPVEPGLLAAAASAIIGSRAQELEQNRMLPAKSRRSGLAHKLFLADASGEVCVDR
eukprot:TRINITY_DN46982_c0_g1_i1.p1 TRINITY_DN46982_c0_g1~~TRINITY_DN46982_c0_g1_i1.p1  ORF type:complete len:175 (+),score=29.61 TRINITY_DN46982_c0_g1_i1:82-606(+)